MKNLDKFNWRSTNCQDTASSAEIEDIKVDTVGTILLPVVNGDRQFCFNPAPTTLRSLITTKQQEVDNVEDVGVMLDGGKQLPPLLLPPPAYLSFHTISTTRMSDADYEEMLAEKELVTAAFHEVSHALLHRYFDRTAVPQVWRNHGHSKRGERAWRGRCISTSTVGLTARQMMLISIAGFIGEQLVLSKRDGISLQQLEGEIEALLFNAIDSDELSASDLEGFNRVNDAKLRRGIAKVLSLLSASYDQVESEAVNMIVQARNAHVKSRPCKIRFQFSHPRRESRNRFLGAIPGVSQLPLRVVHEPSGVPCDVPIARGCCDAANNRRKKSAPMPRRTMARINQRRLYPAAQLMECKASPSAPCSQQRSMR
jgi:hypothetical protein